MRCASTKLQTIVRRHQHGGVRHVALAGQDREDHTRARRHSAASARRRYAPSGAEYALIGTMGDEADFAAARRFVARRLSPISDHHVRISRLSLRHRRAESARRSFVSNLPAIGEVAA